LNGSRHLKTIWNDPVWSKVIAGIILAVLAAIWHFGWFPPLLTFLHGSISIPVWLLLTFFLFVIASTVIYRRRDREKRVAAAKKAKEGAETFDQMVLQLDRNRKSASTTAELTITFSSPQGGMHIVPPPYGGEPQWLRDWFHISAMVRNRDDAPRSACDLIVSLEFTSEFDDTAARRIERALFKDPALQFPSKWCCLEAGHSIEVMLAVWNDRDSVQTIRAWSSANAPLGEELYPGIWWCRVTAQAQGVEESERFRFQVGKHTVSRQMLPPGTVGDTG
jgi:hypothetical protein